jgi:predicted branched-subunit amino acid permease
MLPRSGALGPRGSIDQSGVASVIDNVGQGSLPMSVAPSTKSPQRFVHASFVGGFRAAWLSILAYVLIGTYVGVAALAHDFGFSLWWALASTVLVWAGPGQVILISALGAGATSVETALAVGVSSARLLPMVMSLLPLIRRPWTRNRDLILPAHLTAASMWIESLRLLPILPREERLSFSNGLGIGFMTAAHAGTLIGYFTAWASRCDEWRAPRLCPAGACGFSSQ